MTEPRLPADLEPPRMEALARLPVFLALESKRAVLAGGTAQAAWKAELLSAAGAAVDVFAEAPDEEMTALAAKPPRGAIAIIRRRWTKGDFAGATVAVGAFADDDEAAAFSAAARAAGVPVNVIDKPAFCDFAFGAIVNRSPLVIGISTAGAAPVFGQEIRGRLEAMIPRGFASWAAAARHWRAAVASSGLSLVARRSFWRLFTSHAVTHCDREPQQADFDDLLGRAREKAQAAERGSITLVGAGPGDAELLTLRAARALQGAEVIVIEDRVAPAIVDFARREARKMLVGGAGDAALTIKLAHAGRRVVYLMHGDPVTRSDAQDLIAAIRAAGITMEMVPGLGTPAAVRPGVEDARPALAK